jgi:hypothetical protein
VNFHFALHWQHSPQFPVAHQRLTAYERHVQRTMDLYKPQDSIHQIIAAVVAQVSQIDGAAQMGSGEANQFRAAPDSRAWSAASRRTRAGSARQNL